MSTALENWFTNGTPEQIPTDTSYGLIASLPGISTDPIYDSNGVATGNFKQILASANEFRIPTMDITSEHQAEQVYTYNSAYNVVIPINPMTILL